jgi:hypothetical protein
VIRRLVMSGITSWPQLGQMRCITAR